MHKISIRYLVSLPLAALFFSIIFHWSCSLPENPGVKKKNAVPFARLANVPPSDPVVDTLGTDGQWNAEFDLGVDGLPDIAETTACGGTAYRTYHPIYNPDPAYDNYSLTEVDSCTEGYPVKSDRKKYTQGNGIPDVGEPHVYKFRTTKSPIVRLFWVGNDADGYVTAFAYRWTFRHRAGDTLWNYNPTNPSNPSDPFYKWRIIVNYVIPSSVGGKNLVLMMDLDTNTAKIAAPIVFKFFANAAMDPDKLNRNHRDADTNLIRIYDDLDAGKTVLVKGYPVYASNPPKVQYPVHESPNSGTFVFESDDFKNRHIFEIVAIDNESAIGPRDIINFWTPKAEPPIVTIIENPGTAPLFVLKNKTYTWPGIRFVFRGRDRNSRTIEYSWKVDSKDWSLWSYDPVGWVTASSMDTPYTGVHILRVRCRNEFGGITPESEQPTFRFTTVYPKFADPGYPRRMLVVHSSQLSTIDSLHKPNLNSMMDYYRKILDSTGIAYDVWVTVGRRHPGYDVLARYTSVYLISDQYLVGGTSPELIPGKVYSAYLAVGGKMVYNGVFWLAIRSVIENPEALLEDRMHYVLSEIQRDATTDFNRGGVFEGAFGSLGYPNVEVDPLKLPPGKLGIPNCATTLPAGFGEIIYRFNALDTSGVFSRYNNGPVGIRYMGITFKTVYLGFPLYFIKQDQATAVLRKALKDIGEL